MMINKNNCNKRNHFLDFIKFIAFCLVVVIHCPFPGEIGKLLTALARIAVPIFLGISGMFYKENKEKSYGKFIKYLIYYIVYSFIWFCIYNIISNTQYFALAKYAQLNISIKNIVKSVFFGVAFGNEYLWYLHAIAFTYLFMNIYKGQLQDKLSIIYIISYFGMVLVGVTTVKVIFQKNIPVFLYRNWLFWGVPWFLLGKYISLNTIKCLENNSYILLFIGIISSILEYRYWGSLEIYAGSVLIVIALLVLCKKRKMKKNCLSTIGAKYSLQLYLYHPFVWLLIQFIERKYDFEQGYILWFNPLLVILGTVCMTVISKKIIELIKGFCAREYSC